MKAKNNTIIALLLAGLMIFHQIPIYALARYNEENVTAIEAEYTGFDNYAMAGVEYEWERETPWLDIDVTSPSALRFAPFNFMPQFVEGQMLGESNADFSHRMASHLMGYNNMGMPLEVVPGSANIIVGSPSQLGRFDVPSTMGFPFDSGIILSTARADIAFTDNISGGVSLQGHPDFSALTLAVSGTAFSTFSAFILEFQIVPDTGMLYFEYFFASSEFNQPARFNDVFALWIVGQDGSLNNIALLPSGAPVTVRSILPNIQDWRQSTPPYYISHSNGRFNGYPMQFHGRSIVLTADATNNVDSTGAALIQPGVPVTIRMGIANVSDDIVPSAVFIRAHSINSQIPPNTYAVDFNMNGAIGIPPARQYIRGGQTATRPQDPTCSIFREFDGWYLDSANTIPFDFATPITSNITLYARWGATGERQVTFSVNPASGGNITATIGGNSIVSGTSHTIGDNVVFNVSLAPSHNIVSWTVNGTLVTGAEALASTITRDVTSNGLHIVVTLEGTYPVTFSASPDSSGNVTATMGGTSITSGILIREGEDVIFVASPITGYRLSHWRVNGSPLTNAQGSRITVTTISETVPYGGLDVVAVFLPNEVVTFSVEPANLGSITANLGVGATPIVSGSIHPPNTLISFSATPNNYHHVSHWLVNGNRVFGSEALTNLMQLMPPSPAGLDVVAVITNNPPVTFRVEPPHAGTITSAIAGTPIVSGHTTHPPFTAVNFHATPSISGYNFVGWRVNGFGLIPSSSNYEYTITRSIDNLTGLEVVAHFLPYFPVTFTAGAGGSISAYFEQTLNTSIPITSGEIFDLGDRIRFEAIPNFGYTVYAWIVNGVNFPINPYILTRNVPSNGLHVEVLFAPKQPITFEVFGPGGVIGTHANVLVSLTGSPTALPSGTLVPVGSNATILLDWPVSHIVTSLTVNGVDFTDKIFPMPFLNGVNSTTMQLVPIGGLHIVVHYEYIPHGLYPVTFRAEPEIGGFILPQSNQHPVFYSGTYHYAGEFVIFFQFANLGFEFTHWSVNGVVVPDIAFSSVGGWHYILTRQVSTGGLDVVAHFQLSHPQTVVFDSGPRGYITAYIDNANITSGSLHDTGTTVTFIAEPQPGFQVAYWVVNGVTIMGDEAYSLVIIRDVPNTPGGLNVFVEFKPIPPTYYLVNFFAGAGGNITAAINGASILTGTPHPIDTDVVFNVAIEPHFRIDYWTVNGNDVTYAEVEQLISTREVPQDGLNVFVAFYEVFYAVTFAAGTGGSITAESTGNQIVSGETFHVGTYVEFEATPAMGYRVAGWMVNGVSLDNVTASTISRYVTGLLDVIVIFERIPSPDPPTPPPSPDPPTPPPSPDPPTPPPSPDPPTPPPSPDPPTPPPSPDPPTPPPSPDPPTPPPSPDPPTPPPSPDPPTPPPSPDPPTPPPSPDPPTPPPSPDPPTPPPSPDPPTPPPSPDPPTPPPSPDPPTPSPRPPRPEPIPVPSVVLSAPNEYGYILYRWFIQGYTDRSVQPDGFMTRAEMAQMFFNLSTSLDKYYTIYDAGFTDVHPEDWHFTAINYFAMRHNSLYGFPDGSFRPNQIITNAEFLAFATRYFNLAMIAPYSGFYQDFEHWATDYIAYGFDPLWIDYFGDDYVFYPNAPISRAIAVTLVNHYIGRIVEPERLKQFLQGHYIYVDITTEHWAFFEIISASLTHHFRYDSNGNESWYMYENINVE